MHKLCECPNLSVKRGSVFFLDSFFVLILSIILILSAILLVRNINRTLVNEGISEAAFSHALDISENLINSPGCVSKNCSVLWDGQGTPEIVGLAKIGENGVIQSYVIDLNKAKMVNIKGNIGLWEIGYNISLLSDSGLRKVSQSEKSPEFGVYVIRRLVGVDIDNKITSGILEVRVII